MRRGNDIDFAHLQLGTRRGRLEHRFDFARCCAGPATDPCDDHGLTHVHWVTGMADRHPRFSPTLSARAKAIRNRPPPKLEYRCSNSASVSRVTAFTTSRPPDRRT